VASPDLHPAAAQGFGSNAADYERTRPGYPPEALAHLVAVHGLRPGTTVLDVAAGTGKLTRLLLTTGARVVAVEPVAAMRAVLAETSPGAVVLDGTAEDLPVEDGSVDAVTVAQAFHWFDGRRALAECARVLAPGRALSVVYNHRDRDAAWLAGVNRLVEVHRRGTPQQWDGGWRAAFAGEEWFGPLDEVAFDNPQTLDVDDFVGRIRSMSYVGALPAEPQAALLDDVARLIATHPDTAGRREVVIGQRTVISTCRRR